MNIVPNLQTAGSGIRNFFAGLGWLPSILLVIVVIAVLWYAWGGISGAWDSYKARQEIAAAKKEADEARAEADQQRQQKEQALGMVIVLKEQAAKIEQELVELQNARPELQQRVETTRREVERIRDMPLRPVTNDADMQRRIDELGTKLDQLYPGNGN